MNERFDIIKSDFKRLLAAVESLKQSLEMLDFKKEVPYISQWDVEANEIRGDCGPACLTMILRYFLGDVGTVNEIAKLIGQTPQDNSTNFHQLRKGALHFELEAYYSFGHVNEIPVHQVDENSKIILLIDYGELRDQLKKYPAELQNQDIRYNFGHFVVLLGETETHYVVHDPDFWGSSREKGAFREIPKAALQAAYNSVAPGNRIHDAYLLIFKK